MFAQHRKLALYILGAFSAHGLFLFSVDPFQLGEENVVLHSLTMWRLASRLLTSDR